MATMITSECINCGACEPECPNTAIYQGGVEWDFNGAKHAALSNDIFFIVPEKCTECVGFFDKEACAAVCPVDCCIPNPDIPETEAQLLVRAGQLHPDKTFGGDSPSRFKADGAAASAPVAAGAPAAPTPAAGPAPAQAVAAATATSAATADPAATSVAAIGVALPPIDEWEVPIECFRCQGAFAVAYRHFRSGVVFYCPYCQGSTVINTSMHNAIAKELRDFYGKWTAEFDAFQDKRHRELVEFEERQKQRLERVNESLRQRSVEFRPAGKPRKRAGIFG